MTVLRWLAPALAAGLALGTTFAQTETAPAAAAGLTSILEDVLTLVLATPGVPPRSERPASGTSRSS